MRVIKQDFYAVKHTALVIHAPFSGKVLAQSESTNPLVSNQLLGLGVELDVSNYQLYAPFSGTLLSVNQGGLEFIFKSKQGVKLLVLIALKDDFGPMTGFKQHIRLGEQYSAGQLIASFDFRKQQHPVRASILLLEPERLNKVLDKCYYQAKRVTAGNDILFKLTKRINHD
ncbi:PTS glucose transporter subunit IIA [Pseudoalteromonas sp.]|uniref:PTS glucose transporter subunit IIA n=1 Tax=Pseudoalteromonas sp. TaxID=53249 RepID=UPI00356875E5